MRHLIRLSLALFLAALPAGHLYSGALGTGSQTCPASGTKALSTVVTKASWVSIQAPNGTGGLSTNTGYVFVGDSAVTTSKGNGIAAGGTLFMPTQGTASPYALSQIYIACTVSADSVMFLYLQ